MPLRVANRIAIHPVAAPEVPAAPTATERTAEARGGAIMLDVPFVRQEQTQWCWAACAQMVANSLGITAVKQCALANFLHGQTRCCQQPSSARCNLPSPYPGIGKVYRHLEINCISEPHAETIAVLLKELTAGRPVEVGYLWYGGGGHVAIVYGVTQNGLFAVHDPWFGSGTVTYMALLTAYGSGVWGMSFGDFRKLS